MTIKEALGWASEQLQSICERPLFEAELLLAYHLHKERIYLHAHEHDKVDSIDTFKALIARRSSHEPYEYIVGKASFYDIELFVKQGVLIPRPETELLIDEVAHILEKEKISSIAEIGVGSGAISIVLARKFPSLKIIATDISLEAIAIAKQNIEAFGLSDQITLVHTNLLDGIEVQVGLIVSNPPYIASNAPLESNVKDYEPHTALFGGERGDELLQQIITQAKQKGASYLACEMGYDQKASMELFLTQSGVQYTRFYDDLAGLNRGFITKF
ncbi:MAG: peptide chain release factor N(5)-glutamine methyltransferase [Campylobacterales bacterium]|nr:peptide chain release factor N(5)-glutamine methyltransferase [Campylobacterales bacterium]